MRVGDFGHLAKSCSTKKMVNLPWAKWWNGYGGCLDFKTFAVDWLESKLKALQSTYGISGFKIWCCWFWFYPKRFSVLLMMIQIPTLNSGRIIWKVECRVILMGTCRLEGGNQPLAQRLLGIKGYSWDELKVIQTCFLRVLIGHPLLVLWYEIGGGYLSNFEKILITLNLIKS
jgi:hypothetical protein